MYPGYIGPKCKNEEVLQEWPLNCVTVFSAYTFPIVLCPSHVTFKILAVTTKNMANIVSWTTSVVSLVISHLDKV